jgi:DNA-binding response OmpR family regulator
MLVAGKRILVVEDETIIAMMIEDFLADIGYDVVAIASRLNEARQVASTAMIDIAMLDVNLAGELSYPVASILRSRNIPFLFATGYGVIGLPPELQDTKVLVKPFTQMQLADALHAARTI